MRQPPAHIWRGRLAVASTTVVLAAAWALALGSPAAAHDALEATDPADGAVLDEAPTQVVLTFAAEQAGVGAEVVVTGPDGASWTDGPAVVSGTTVTQPLAPGMPDGGYTVAWRSVAQDGHPVTGAFTFSLDAPDAEPADEPATGETASSEPTDDAAPAEPSAPATSEASDGPTASPAPTGSTEPTGSGGWTTWHTMGAALVAALAGAAAFVARRSRRG